MGDDESDKLVDKSHDFDRRIRINISREKIAEEEPEQRLSKSSSRTSILSKGSDDRHLSDCQVWMFEKFSRKVDRRDSMHHLHHTVNIKTTKILY